MLDLSSRKVYGALAEQCVGGDAKADKVETAVAGHLAGLDSNGNLTDSGVSPTEDVTVEGNPVTFDSPFEQDAKSVVVSVKPIQAGSGTPSPENIRPISGIDEVEIGVSGKNELNPTGSGVTQNAILDPQTGGTTSHNNYNVSEYMVVESDSTYIYSGVGISSPSAALYDEHKNFVSFISDARSPITIPNGVKYIRIELIKTATNQQFEKGSTPTAYEPYKGSTTTIPLPSTLYDADVDVTEGEADNKHGFIDGDSVQDLIDLGASTTSIGSGLFAIYFPNFSTPHDSSVLTPTTDLKCNEISNVVPSEQWEANASGISINNQGHVIFTVKDITTQADMDAWLTANPIQIAYKLATPATISLTPTDVELLEGTNVVSTNAEKVAVTYGRSLWQDIDELKTDTEGKLNKSDVADVEGDTASRAYSVNEFMLRSDGFYRVTQPIASGASITASNTTKTTIGAVLTALLNA